MVQMVKVIGCFRSVYSLNDISKLGEKNRSLDFLVVIVINCDTPGHTLKKNKNACSRLGAKQCRSCRQKQILNNALMKGLMSRKKVGELEAMSFTLNRYQPNWSPTPSEWRVRKYSPSPSSKHQKSLGRKVFSALLSSSRDFNENQCHRELKLSRWLMVA